jgi:hypothetical protein
VCPGDQPWDQLSYVENFHFPSCRVQGNIANYLFSYSFSLFRVRKFIFSVARVCMPDSMHRQVMSSQFELYFEEFQNPTIVILRECHPAWSLVAGRWEPCCPILKVTATHCWFPAEPSWHKSLQSGNARPPFTKSHFRSCARERHRKQPALRGCSFDFRLRFCVKGWALSLGFQNSLSGNLLWLHQFRELLQKSVAVIFQSIYHASKQLIREICGGEYLVGEAVTCELASGQRCWPEMPRRDRPASNVVLRIEVVPEILQISIRNVEVMCQRNGCPGAAPISRTAGLLRTVWAPTCRWSHKGIEKTRRAWTGSNVGLVLQTPTENRGNCWSTGLQL